MLTYIFYYVILSLNKEGLMNYYDEIKEKIIKSEIYDRVKDYSKNRHKVAVYFEIGKLLSEAGKEYGKNIMREI